MPPQLIPEEPHRLAALGRRNLAPGACCLLGTRDDTLVVRLRRWAHLRDERAARRVLHIEERRLGALRPAVLAGPGSGVDGGEIEPRQQRVDVEGAHRTATLRWRWWPVLPATT